MTRILCNIELNEVNFDLLDEYLSSYPLHRWPRLRDLVSQSKINTISENKYELLEPWIQWASVHTGKTADEHKIFRLGDIKNYDGEQIFDCLEKDNITVGCISAMNADNRLSSPAYFIPDPWTVTDTDGSFFSRKIYDALHQSVNDNVTGKLTKTTIFYLLMSLLAKSRSRNWPLYIRLVKNAASGKKWCKALFLDLFISDLHLKSFKSSKPRFTTVFFNAFAHIQHHYYFNSKFYKGTQENPDWYINKNEDPFLITLDVYDKIIGDHFETFKNCEVVVTTGLRQTPYIKTKYYYRLIDHKNFLYSIGLSKFVVHPRMTRDFLVEFQNEIDCASAATKLQQLSINGQAVFNEIDNRGCSLFVTLTYPNEIFDHDVISLPNGENLNAADQFAFVAIKNGMHDAHGYSFTTKDNSEFRELDGRHVKELFEYFQHRLLA